MKTKLFILGLLMAACSLFTACQDDDNTGSDFDNKEKILLSRYPQAENINWKKSKDNRYDIATFTLPSEVTKAANRAVDMLEVWFGQNDNICLITREIAFPALPDAIKNSFQHTKCNPAQGLLDETLLNTSYSNTQIWEIDDIYKLERDGAISYKIEMEAHHKEVEINLYYDEQGILLREVTDDQEIETPFEIPNQIKEWINTNHQNAEILTYERESEKGRIEHELVLKEGKIILEITLGEINGGLTILEEEYNYPNLDALPEDIRAKANELLATLQDMSGNDIQEIEMRKDLQGKQIYSIELEKGNKEITIKIIKDNQGNIITLIEKD